MKTLLMLAFQSLSARKSSALLTIFAIAISVALLLGVERVREEARQTFLGTISGTDLVVGARSSPQQLLLSSVFNIGNPANTISDGTISALKAFPQIEWLVPLSASDNHRGFRMIGTQDAYFEHFRYGRNRKLEFAQGKPFENDSQVVLGSQVAEKLGYDLGNEVIAAHGFGRTSFHQHKGHPLYVSGILKPTGTPVDQILLLDIAGVIAIHEEESSEHGEHDGHEDHAKHDEHEDHAKHDGHEDHAKHDEHEDHAKHDGHEDHAKHDEHADHAKHDGHEDHAEHDEHEDHGDKHDGSYATSVLVGLKSKLEVLTVQRVINNYKGEPLTAAVPGIVFSEIWQVIGRIENVLRAISAFVGLTAIIGLVISLLSSLNERRREISILRAIGAGGRKIMFLLLGETLLLAMAGVTLGIGLLYGLMWIGQPLLLQYLGIHIGIGLPGTREILICVGLILVALVAAMWPAWRAYKIAVRDGMVTST